MRRFWFVGLVVYLGFMSIPEPINEKYPVVTPLPAAPVGIFIDAPEPEGT